MTTPFRHPTDDTLFDLIEGSLDAARVMDVERHLARCSACAAFVASARVGRSHAVDAVESFPATSVASFDAAIDAAWDERIGATTALPVTLHGAASEDARVVDDTIQLELPVPPARSGTRGPERTPSRTAARPVRHAARPRRRFVRQAIPVFAVIIVGVLAGTSVYVDGLDSGGDGSSNRDSNRSSEAQSSDAPRDSAASDDSATSAESAGRGDGIAQAPSASSGDAAAPKSPASPGDDGRGEESGGASATGDVGQTDGDEVCIATNDPSQLYLPEGRVPREVIDGPLGTFVVCG